MTIFSCTTQTTLVTIIFEVNSIFFISTYTVYNVDDGHDLDIIDINQGMQNEEKNRHIFLEFTDCNSSYHCKLIIFVFVFHIGRSRSGRGRHCA